MKYFRELGIKQEVLDALEDEAFEKPTEIQRKSIPLILEGRDVVGSAATGSGKTLAFASRIIGHSNLGAGIQALVLTPTRELAEQVKNALKKFSRYKRLKTAVIYGGTSIHPQIKLLKQADVVVGTPGRILDHLSRRTLDLAYINILVLDEADRLLDMGFLNDVEKIINHCPKKRQTILFSATISKDIEHLIKKHMHNPASVSAEAEVDPLKLRQTYFEVSNNMKFSALVHLLRNEESELIMVFCNSRNNVDFISNNLLQQGFDVQAIHGGFSQQQRSKALDKFHSQNAHVLVATDVAARGLDIPYVSHVYNYDIPKEAKQYIHRIGRTARAGKHGQAISILSPQDHNSFRQVLKFTDAKIERKELPEIERIQIRWRESPRSRGTSFRGSRIDYKRKRYREKSDYY